MAGQRPVGCRPQRLQPVCCGRSHKPARGPLMAESRRGLIDSVSRTRIARHTGLPRHSSRRMCLAWRS